MLRVFPGPPLAWGPFEVAVPASWVAFPSREPTGILRTVRQMKILPERLRRSSAAGFVLPRDAANR